MKFNHLKSIFTFLLLVIALPIQAKTAKLVIVIDDIGYRPNNDAKVYKMPQNINVAIIPSAPYAKKFAKIASEQDRDTLIHMPMQPKAKIKIEKEALTIGLSAEEVAQRVDMAYKIIPNAIGMNNHMGSAATTNLELMQHLMQHLAKLKLFFLDSKTAANTVTFETAKQQNVPILARNIFLDDSNHYADVKKQFQLAIKYAQQHGSVIVIGHPRKNTLKVLNEELPNLPPNIKLTKISELWRQQVIPAKPFNLFFGNISIPIKFPPFTH